MMYPRMYFDYNSTTPFAPGVFEAMRPYLSEEFGNPSSSGNDFGLRAKAAIEKARGEIAKFLQATNEEVVFTSGGTESIFAALIGTFRGNPGKRHMITSAVEHPAVLEAAEFAREMLGVEVSRIPVSSEGALDLSAVRAAIRPDTALLSFMYANNETGVRFPLAELAAISKERGILLHTDAVQATGKEIISFSKLGVDLLSLSGHKFGASKGVGALLVKKGIAWTPIVRGGGQESGRRGGTECVSLIVGLGEASRIRLEQLESGASENVLALRDRFEEELRAVLPGVLVNGSRSPRLSNTSSVRISGILSSDLIPRLRARGIILSAGAACKASKVEPSHVLRAMGLEVNDCLATLRISFGFSSSESEMKELVLALGEEVGSLRAETKRELDGLRREIVHK